MEAVVIGEGIERRGDPSLVTATASSPLGAATFTGGISLAPTGIQLGASAAVPIPSAQGVDTSTTTGTASAVTLIASITPTSEPSATQSAAPASNGALPTTTLIAILVPICVVLALIPTIAYLCYLRRRDRRNREMEAEIMRGRLAPSGASAHTADALLMRRSMSASSQREPKYPSVSTEDLDLAAMEKGPRQPEIRDSASIFAPQQHGLGRRGAPGSVDTARKPGVPVPPVASQSPTLPPLNFDKDSADNDPFSMTSTSSPPRPTVPATLPSFAPAQPKRTPNPALAPAPSNTRSNTASPSPNPAGTSPAVPSSKASPHVSNMDNPNWPLPAPSARDSASTYSSASTAPVANKPLPSSLSCEMSSGPTVVPRNQSSRTQQPGPRESSIAYGMPPIPPSPQKEHGEVGDRRSGASRKRDSDAVSELSYSISVRGKRDTRRDTDAISVVSAMSDKER